MEKIEMRIRLIFSKYKNDDVAPLGKLTPLIFSWSVLLIVSKFHKKVSGGRRRYFYKINYKSKEIINYAGKLSEASSARALRVR